MGYDGTVLPLRQMLIAQFYNAFIDFNHDNLFDSVMLQYLAQGGALTTTNDSDTFWIWVRDHGGMDNTLVVGSIPKQCALNNPIQEQYAICGI